MSIKPMTWALYEAPVDDPAQLLVLWALCDRADDEGRNAWPSQSWLAERARCSVRSVRRHLKALEDARVIKRGDQELVSHFRADHRPIVWDVDISLRRASGQIVRPVNLSGRTPEVEPQDRERHHDRTTVADNTSLTPYGSKHIQIHPEVDPIEADFKEWYSHYPVKKAPGDALKAYRGARKKADAATLLAAVKGYRFSKDKTYIKHPATWLRKECWLDEDAQPQPEQPRYRGVRYDNPVYDEETGRWI